MKTLLPLTKRFFFTLLLSLIASISYGEGTRELTPTAADDNHGVLQIWDNNDAGRNSFTYNAPPNRRLYFDICLPGETVYFGVNYETGDLGAPATVYYRIKFDDGTPTGQIVAGPFQITNAGVGSIANYTQAAAGPSNMPGGSPAGYNARFFDPMAAGTGPGRYWVEFNRNDPNTYNSAVPPNNTSTAGGRRKTRFRFFDLTIYDDASVSGPVFGSTPGVRTGRLFSQAWDINVNGANFEFNSTMYVYADDGIVTGLNFNGIRPFGFVISCNASGVTNSGIPNVDRQSVSVNATFAQYKIFLNNPDINCFPTGTFGAVTSPVTITGCDVNNRCINVTVNKAGPADLLLDLNGTAGYQPGTSDVLLRSNLVVGTNCIPWNGRDGLGNLVATGINIPMRLDYFDGLTHLPLFDVENHPRGFIVSLVRPAGPAPRLFWDDSQLPGGNIPPGGGGAGVGVQLAGYATGLPTNGGHRWGTNTAGTVVPGGISANYGDNRTLNTWWYANIIQVNATYDVPGNIAVDANTLVPGTGASNDQAVCSNISTINLNGSVSGATGGIWSGGLGGTFGSATSVVTTYTPSPADFTAGFIKLFLTSTGNGSCPAVKDSIRITINPGPTVDAGPNRTVCANNPTASLAGTFSVATGVQWSGGLGTYVPNSTTATATYTPTAAEITTGSVTLTLTTTGNGLCPAASDQMTITIQAAPTVDAGSNVSTCANNVNINLVGTTTNSTSVLWSGGGGSFGSAGSVTSTYIPSATEINNAPTNITLTLSAFRAGCNPVTDNVTVSITPRPTVNAGSDRTICKNDSVNLVGSVTVASGGVWSGGSGIFTPNANTLTANYKPSASEILGNSVTLTLTSTGNGNCLPVTDQMTINLLPSPTISAGPDVTVCQNNSTVNLSATFTGAPNVLWVGSGGTFVPNTAAPSVQYTPSAIEILAGVTGVIVRTNGGSCPPVQDTVFITINPAPTVDAGPPVSICKNNPTGTLNGTVSGTSTFTWSSPTGGLFSDANSLTSTYTASANDISSGTVTLTLTATFPGCNPVSDNVVVTLTNPPIVDAGPVRNVCENNATSTLNGTFSGSTGVQWTTNGTGSFGSPTNPISTYIPSSADATLGTVTVTLTTTGNGNCAAVSSNTTINIRTAPVVNAGPDQSVCANNPSFNLAGTVTGAGGGRWIGGTTSGFTPNRNQLITTYTPTAAEIASGSITLTLESTGNGTCNPVQDNITITITPSPTVDAGNPVSVCADNPVANLSATVTVATGVTWSGGAGTFSNPNALNTTYTPTLTEINNGTVTLTAITTGNGLCTAVSDNVTVTITPAPTINAGSDQTVCGTVATVASVTATTTVATGVTWTIVNGTGTLSSPNSFTTNYTPSANDIINGSVTLRATSTGNGLCQAVSDIMIINYTPEPSINAGTDQIVCSTELPINLNATGSPAVWQAAGGTYGNANNLSTTYMPTAGQISAGTVTLTITTIASGACPSKSDQITISIPPGPVVNTGADNQTMCGSQASYPITASISNASGGFWTTSGTGSFTPNNTTINATYVPSAADRTAGSVVLTLTSTGNGTCLQVSDNFTLTITPAITVFAGPDQTLCGDVTGLPLTGAINVASSGTWSIVSGTGTIASPSSLSTTYNLGGGDVGAGSVTLRLTSTGNGSCPAISDDVTYTLTPAPTLNPGANQTICADSAYVQLGATITIASGVSWSSNGTGTFTTDNVSLNSRYIPSAADISAGSVTLTATTTGNGTCNAISSSITVTITPRVTLNAGIDQTVCGNNSIVNLNAAVTVAGAVNWTTSGSGTFANQTSPTTTYTPSPTDISNGLVTLTVVTTGNGTCKAKTDQVIVTITPAPTVNAGLPQTVCANTSGVTLNGVVTTATGGTWSTVGSGTFANANNLVTSYIPSSADTSAGNVILTLTTTGNGTCNAVTSNVTISFDKVPVVNAGPDQVICADSAYVQLAGKVFNATGGTWTSTGSGNFFPIVTDLNGVYSPSLNDRNGIVPITITLTSATNGTCPSQSDNFTITITQAPTITVSPDQTVCANNPVANFSGTFTVASGIKWTSTGTGTFSPSNTNTSVSYTPSALDISAGSVVISMSTTGNGTCKAARQFRTLTITPRPTVNAGPDKTICADSLGVVLNNASFTVAGGVQWTILNGTGVFGPNSTVIQPEYFPTATDKTNGFVTLRVQTTNNGNCLPVSDTIRINITPAPTVNAGTDKTVCADTAGVTLAGSSTVAGGVIWTSTGTGIFSPSATSPTATYIPSNADTTAKTVTLTLTTTNNGTCKAVSDQMSITITPEVILNAGSDNILCADADQIVLDGTLANATGVLWSTSGTGVISPSTNTLKPTYSPSAADISNGTVAFTLISTGNGLCQPKTDNVLITFTPVPTISAGNDLQVCNTVTTVNINGSETNTSGITWSIITGAGSISTNNALNTVYTVDPADLVSGVTLKISGSGNSGCATVEDVMQISFVASPPIDAGTNRTVCSTDFPIQLQGTGSSAQWSGYSGTMTPNDQTLNALYTPSAGEVSAGTVTLTLTTVNNGACPANSDMVTFTIIDGPVVDAGSVPTICTNTPTVNLTGSTNGLSSTGVTWSTSGTGTFSSSSSLTPTYTPSASDYSSGFVILTIQSAGTNPACKVAKDTAVLRIQPRPTINAGNDVTICKDALTIPVSTLITNATGVNWTLGTNAAGSFNNSTALSTTYNVVTADTTVGNIVLVVSTTGHNPNCPAATDNVNVTFTSRPTVFAGNPIVVCEDTSFVPLNGTVGVATGGIWSTSGTGVFTPSNSALNAKYVPSAADTTAGNVTLTLTTTGNGTCNAYSSTVGITFNDRPTVNVSGINDTICSGNVITITGVINNSSGLQWFTTGTGTFSNPTSASTIYTPSTADKDAGGVILFARTTGGAPCKDVEDYLSFTILTDPSALVNAGFDQTVCADAAFIILNGTIGGIASGGIWTSSSGLGDYFPDVTDLNPFFIPDVSDVAAGTVTLRLTTTGNSICPPSFDDMVLTILPAPIVDAGNDITVCSDTAYVQLTMSVTNAGGGVWSTTGSGYFSPSSVDPNAVYVPSDADRSFGSVGITLTSVNNGTCNTYTDFKSITLTPQPTINIGPDQLICANNISTLQANVTVATGANWRSSGTGVFFSPNPSLSNTYIPSAIDTAAKVVNIIVESAGQGACKPVYDTLKLNLQPTPVVIASSDQNICADFTSITVSATIDNATSVTWSTNGSGTYSPSASGSPVTYILSTQDQSLTSLKLYATSNGNSVCSSTTDSILINIAPSPIVSTGSPIICDTLAGATLTGSVTNASSGVWTSSSGLGVFSVNNATLNAVYVPSHTDIVNGSVTLTLTSVGNGTCKAVSSSTLLLIEPLPIANAGQDQFTCVNNSVTLSASTIEAGVSYAWLSSTGTLLSNGTNFTTTALGNQNFVLRATNAKGCQTTDTVNVSTFTLPTFTFTPNPLCYTDNVVVNSNPTPTPTVPGNYQWFNNGGIMTGKDKPFLVPPASGSYQIMFSFGGCNTTGNAVVNPSPRITVQDVIACSNANLTASSDIVTSTWNWEAPLSGSSATITAPAIANDTIKYFVNNTVTATGCSTRDSVYVIGIPVPQMISIDSTSCQGLTVRLTARPTNIPYLDLLIPVSFNWTNGGTSFSTDSAVTVNSVGTYIGTANIGQCTGISTNNIGFSPNPVSDLADKIKYCIEDSTIVTLDPGNTGGPYTYSWSTGETTQTIFVQPALDEYFKVTLTNSSNCITVDSILVRVICPPKVYVPSAFTPGSGNVDAIFRGFGKDQYISKYEVMVFNRWGEIIFVSNDKNMGWDGTYLGEIMPMGVYPYIIRYEGYEEYKGPFKINGSVTLIR
jgi:gliding motility-associated-like protein